MYEKTLEEIGLSPNQAAIYEILIKNGQLTAGKIAQKSPLKRGLVYKILEELVALNIIEKAEEPRRVAVFKPNHPLKLKDLAESREQKARDSIKILESLLPSLTSDFSLSAGRPGIKFYEGVEGFKKISADSLTAKTEIYSYTDNEAIEKYISRENKEYAQKRYRLKIVKRMLSVDSEFIRNRAKSFNPEFSKVRVLKMPKKFSDVVMQIYDNKISYLTLKPELMLGVIIEDELIANMHRVLFEQHWSGALAITVGENYK